jgi:hypothetical protein
MYNRAVKLYLKKAGEKLVFLWAFIGVIPALILRFVFGKRFDVRCSLGIALVCSVLIFLLQLALEGQRTFVFGITFPIVYAVSKDEEPKGMNAREYHGQKRK